MKKISLQLVICICCIGAIGPVTAKKIDVNRAMAAARGFLDNNQIGKQSKKIVANDLYLAYTESYGSIPIYYVFNIRKGGFVITSADDRAVEILAYVDKGSFDPVDLPDNVRWWLNEYAGQIKAVCAMPEMSTKQAVASRAVKAEILPMLETEWSQEDPYNGMCVYNNGSGISVAAAGCNATSMAQIMYYHKWPEKGNGSYSYDYELTIGGKEVPQHMESNFSEHIYDYAAMLPSYRQASYTQEEADAVALLIYDCAISVNSLFDDIKMGTAGASNWVIYSMVDYFGYSKLAKEVYRDNLSTNEEWENLIYNDLAAGMPVFYAGKTDDGSGHSFVCDGYKDGLYHINWGWGGTFNGYFSITGVDAVNPYIGAGLVGQGYKNEQYIITGLKPAKDDVIGVVAQDVLTISQSSATRNEELFVMGNIMNISDSEVFMALELTDVLTGEKNITGITDYTFSPGSTFSGLMLNTTDIVKNGTFEVWPIYQVSGTAEWVRVEPSATQNMPIKLTVTGDVPKLYVTKPISFEYGDFTSLENLKLYVELKALKNIDNVELRAYFRQPWNGQTAATLHGTVSLQAMDASTTLAMTPLGSISSLQQGVPYLLELYLYENGQDIEIPLSAYTVIKNATIVSAEEEELLGIGDVTVDSPLVDVYTLSGVRIRNNVSKDDALKNLPKGIYILNGRKVLVK